MSFPDIEESMVWPSGADEAAVAHEEVREAADVGIWDARSINVLGPGQIRQGNAAVDTARK
jgi:hypothetical protein